MKRSEVIKDFGCSLASLADLLHLPEGVYIGGIIVNEFGIVHMTIIDPENKCSTVTGMHCSAAFPEECIWDAEKQCYVHRG